MEALKIKNVGLSDYSSLVHLAEIIEEKEKQKKIKSLYLIVISICYLEINCQEIEANYHYWSTNAVNLSIEESLRKIIINNEENWEYNNYTLLQAIKEISEIIKGNLTLYNKIKIELDKIKGV